MAKTIYFKNFDALRAIAALAVLVGHIESLKPGHDLARFESINLIPSGGIAVTLFFVLSGFLISYLLLNEFTLNGKLNIKHFYLRRILKIWPLYFVVLLVGVFLWGDSVGLTNWLYCVFFLPNVAFMSNSLPSMIDPIWSIGVEEQFYLFFPLLFLLKNPLRIFYAIIMILLLLLSLKTFSIVTNAEWLRDFLYLARYDCMLIGSLGAFAFYFHKKGVASYSRILQIIYSKPVQLLSYGLLLTYLVLVFTHELAVVHQGFALLFAIILINLGTNENSILKLESKYLNKIGVISYGIYLTHQFTNYLVLEYVHLGDVIVQNLVTYTLAITLSILLSAASYYAFEIHFIRLKKRFSLFEK